MKAIASILMPWVSFSAGRVACEDRNDPTETGNLMGQVCEVHGCHRELDEAPMVGMGRNAGSFSHAKRQLFPNSWTAVATMRGATRGGWLRRSRQKTVAVRYCEECRLAADRWMREHLEA